MDLPDLIDSPKSLVLMVLRVLWWLSWDVLIETVAWGVGWLVLRTLTLGRFPREPLTGQDEASLVVAALVQLTGLLALGVGIWWLSGGLPLA